MSDNSILEPPALRSFDGLPIRTTTPDEWGSFVRSEIAKWAKVVKAAGVKVE